MFRYPKMPGPSGAKIEKCVAFDKLDGTNLFWEWHREFGFTPQVFWRQQDSANARARTRHSRVAAPQSRYQRTRGGIGTFARLRCAIPSRFHADAF